MDLEIRPARPSEMDQFGEIAAYVYAGNYGDAPDNLVARSNRPDWTLCAFSGGRMAATFSIIPFTARFFGKAVPLGGISAVGTLPEYRRKGFLRAIMAQALARMREEGQAVSALRASQGAIYQRFGFGLGTQYLHYRFDPGEMRLIDGTPGKGSCERVSPETDFPALRQLYVDHVRDRGCYFHRARELWRNNALAARAEEGPPRAALFLDAAGTPQGYLVYTVRPGRVPHPTRDQEMRVREILALTPEAHRALLEFILRHDLVGRVEMSVPLDDPTGAFLLEPRLLAPALREGIWFRIVDAERALAARGYEGKAGVTIEISGDRMADWNNARFRLECDGEAAEVKRVTSAPDVSLDIRSLASLYTGLRSARTLAGWGLVEGEGVAVEALDALFRVPFAPHCPDQF